MKLLEKMKNLFTEEVEEEKEVKREVKPTPEIRPVTRQEIRENREIEREVKPVEEKKEEKFVFFSDDDFKDLEKKEPVKVKPVPKKEEKVLPYRGATPQIEVEPKKKEFKPSPIISPVYGILDKNYSKDEIVVSKKVPSRSYKTNGPVTVDDIRNKAYGSVEDELKESILGNREIEKVEEENLNDIDIFEELDKIDNIDNIDNTIDVKESFDEIFEELDTKKVEILDELDSKKDEILDELDNKKSDIIINEEEDLEKIFSETLDDEFLEETEEDEENIEEEEDLEEETIALSRQLEQQKKKLKEINEMIDDKEDVEDLNEDELFDLIDSMYDKRDDE